MAWAAGPGAEVVRGASASASGCDLRRLGKVGGGRLDRGVEPGRIQELADAVERLARVTRREALQLRVHRVARAKVHVSVTHERVEPIKRAHRWPAGHHAAEVVHAAVAGADEALRGG